MQQVAVEKGGRSFYQETKECRQSKSQVIRDLWRWDDLENLINPISVYPVEEEVLSLLN